MGSAPRGRVNFSCTCEWHFIKNMYGEPGKSTVGVYVTTYGNHGVLDLHFQVNGKPIAQTFALAGTAMRVGGVRWTVKCPESGKMVRDLYFVLRPNHKHFRSRHALGLSYCSNWPKKRHWEHAKKLMNRLGAFEWGEPPIRPKNMQRRTFERLADELFDACLRDASAILGPARALRGLPGGDVVWKHAWDIGLGDLFAFRGLSPDDVVWNGKTYEYRPPPKGPRGRNSSNQ